MGATEELARLKGRELVGRPYAPLLPFFAQYRLRPDGSRWAFRVVAASYVSTDSGTGIVHQAPAFGEDDFQVGQAEEADLPAADGVGQGVDVGVGQAGQNEATAAVNAARGRAGQSVEVGGATDGHDAASAASHGLDPRLGRINGVDAGVCQQ